MKLTCMHSAGVCNWTPTGTSASLIMKTVSGSIEYFNQDIDLTIFTYAELKGKSGNGEGTIYLVGTQDNLTLVGF